MLLLDTVTPSQGGGLGLGFIFVYLLIFLAITVSITIVIVFAVKENKKIMIKESNIMRILIRMMRG